MGEPAEKTALPIFGCEHARCAECSLNVQRERGLYVPSYPPLEAFNGLMIIGEGPGREEVTKGRPFMGESGRLLDSLLATAEISRDATMLTNATLCQPPFVKKGEDDERKKKGFHDRHPTAVPSCLSRLEAEIAHYRPRVIVTLGTPSLISAIGYTKTKARQVDNPCVRCSNTREVGPAIRCANGECGWTHLFDAPTFEAAKPMHAHLLETLSKPDKKGAFCPKCDARIDRLKIRDVKCPDCGGKKKKVEQFIEFDYDYTIQDVQGTIFEAEKLSSRWDEFGVKYVIPTWHPSFCLREVDEQTTRKQFGGQYAAQAVLDHLIKARKLLTRDYHFRFNVVMTDRAEDIREYTAEPGLYSVDIETNAKNPWDVTDIRCIGIGRADREEVLVVDTQRAAVQKGNAETHAFEIVDHELIGALEDFLTAESKPKVGQNFSYDYICIRRIWGIDTAPIGGDTLAMHHVLRPDEPHNLQAIASELTEAPHWKPPKSRGDDGEHKDVEGFDELAVYNARDVRATALAHENGAGQFELTTRVMPTNVPIRAYTKGGRVSAMLSEYGEHNLRDAYDVDVAVLPIALEMEFFGLPMDVEKMRAMAAEKVPQRDALEREMIEMAERDSGKKGFNPSSVPQLQWLLFHNTGPYKLVSSGRTDTGQPSTKLEDLVKNNDHYFVQRLIKWKELESEIKVLHGKGMIIREDGCVHPFWDTGGARTGRWSSSPNFQNIEEDLRAIVRAPAGWKIIGADESQLELRIMAALSGDPELIRRCRDADEGKKSDPDFDPHAFVASVVFGAAFYDAPKEVRKQLRDLCKHVIYGMNYGAGAVKVLETIYKKGYKGPPIRVEQVKNIIATIFALFKGIPTWREETLARSERDWQVRSPLLHRWRYFPLGKVEATVAWNYPIQSLAADLLNLRIIALKQRLVRERIPHRFMAQVHDAIYILAPEEYAERVATCMNEELSLPLSFNGGPEMPFAATAKIADDWSMKEAA